jgi:sporulation protein YlmC with PRC-barrel domain
MPDTHPTEFPMSKFRVATLFAATFLLSGNIAHAQATSGDEVQDSGVGRVDTAAWIGKPVVGADGKAIGTVRDVSMTTANSDGGVLLVERDGGEELKVPMQGASFDGTSVTVAMPEENADKPATAN